MFSYNKLLQTGFCCWKQNFQCSQSFKLLMPTRRLLFNQQNNYKQIIRESRVRISNRSKHYDLGPKVSKKVFIRCSLFTIVSVNAAFGGAIIWSYENWKSMIQYYRDKKKRQISLFREKFNEIFGRYPRDTDLYYVILGINLLVFVLLNLNFSAKIMPYFLSSPYGPTPALSQLTSAFAHKSIFHLMMNMYVLYNFAPPLIMMMGKEQFLALYTSGCIVSSYFSVFNKSIRRIPLPSLGASGGVCAVLAAFCLLQPRGRLCIPFIVDIVPHSFTASSALPFIVAMEAIGTIFLVYRSPIDHAAHLGGMLFGIFYVSNGGDFFWSLRHFLLKSWLRFRKGNDDDSRIEIPNRRPSNLKRKSDD